MKLKGKLKAERYDVSYYGNPRYRCEIDGTIFYTKPNNMLGYGITNYQGKEVEVHLRHYYGKLTVTKLRELIHEN